MTDDNSFVFIDDDDEEEEEDGADDESSAVDDHINDGESGCFEFSIGVDKIEEVNILKDKVQDLYGVIIQQDIKAKEMGKIDKVERQWFSIMGPLESCRQAKAFILAKCDPGEAAIFDFDPRLYKVLSSEFHKSKIEKESNTVLLFDHGSEGHVIIQGIDEMSVLVAMSLLEEIIYKTSVNVSPYSEDEKEVVDQSRNLGGTSATREKARSCVNENQMEVDIVDLGTETNNVAINIMMSADPEIQRLIKCGRDKHYTDDEIQVVLQKSSSIPKASDFIRALHTCRNVKMTLNAESNGTSLRTNTGPAQKIEICNADSKLDTVNLQETENDVIIILDDDDISKRGICQRENYEAAGVKDNKSASSLLSASKVYTEFLYKNKDHLSETLSDSSSNCSPASDLICISDAEERRQKAEASQQRNRTLYIEQSTSSVLPKQSSTSQGNKLDSTTLSVDVAADKRRKKKKKKKNKNVIDLIQDNDKYSNKLSDRNSVIPVKATSAPEFQIATGTTPNSASFFKGFACGSVLPQKVTALPPAAVRQHQFNMTYPVAPSATAAAPVTSHQSRKSENGLRYIVIDGSNVAMSHGNGKSFSCQGIRIAVEYFRKRGHKEITVFVPQWRRQAPRFDENPVKDQYILENLKEEGVMNFTPSRRIPGKKNIVCYDDRFILRLAEDTNGIVVSNDNYRDLYLEKREWSEIIETRVLSYTFVGDRFMLPDDPLGRYGPNLDEFLSFPSKSVAQASASSTRVLPDQLPMMRIFGPQPVPYTPVTMPVQRFVPPYQHSDLWMKKTNQDFPRYPFTSMSQPRFQIRTASPTRNIVERPTFLQRVPVTEHGSSYKANAPAYCQAGTYSSPHFMQNKPDVRRRMESETAKIRDQLKEIFPDQEKLINSLLLKDETEKDIARLTELVLNKMEEN